MIEKNKEYVVDIIDNGYEGEGIAKIEDFAIFIPGVIKGEKCKILIVKVLKSFAFGKVVEILNHSKARAEVDCGTYKRCGGCNLRHIEYETTLEMKKNNVQNLVNKTLNNKIEVSNVLGMGNPYNYRNKAQFPVGFEKDGITPIMGIFAERTHEIVSMRNCMIHNPISEKISNFIFGFIKQNNISPYNEKTGKGVLRHILIKVGIRTHEVMCVLIVNEENFKKEQELVQELTKEFPEIKTIIKNINTKNTNVILGEKDEILYGDGFIYDKLGDYTFKISAKSFYQINPVQTEALYNIGMELADISENDIVYDLYCGIGTIGIFASKYAKKVYGIEIVEQAIVDAKQNAIINNVKNIEFFSGDVEETFEKILNEKNHKPDVLIVDPPRKGLDINTIGNIIKYSPEKIVYISCNPATLIRDLKLLEEKYEIKKIQPVDMFPFTTHVECVCFLKRREMNL
ncbi:MAG TPA: 23S rRNA (uracil(1939)-C(5))-methyltransferase RlmD [Clostridia bacterium]|nr:23S rRNA (uracil(1939)-C(5))-methyltransferase RlmD [Clostridia bacterium]